jgi:hypothetical protein
MDASKPTARAELVKMKQNKQKLSKGLVNYFTLFDDHLNYANIRNVYQNSGLKAPSQNTEAHFLASIHENIPFLNSYWKPFSKA